MKRTTLFLFLISILIFTGCKETAKQADNEPIKAYDIDFNWGEGGPKGCAGSNTRWGLENPDLSYGVPALPHIPYTTVYLDFLCASIEDTTASAQAMLGEHTRMVTCLANWNGQDAAVVIPDAIRKKNGLYGFTKPVNGSIMPPVDYYLSHHPDSLDADARNIALLARTYNGLPFDYVK
jgi:hypothetical protein